MYISLPKDQTLRTSMASKQKVRHVGNIFTSFNPWSTEANLSFFKFPTMAQPLISDISWMLKGALEVLTAWDPGSLNLMPLAHLDFPSVYFKKHLSTISILSRIFFFFFPFLIPCRQHRMPSRLTHIRQDDNKTQSDNNTLGRFFGRCRLLAWLTNTDVRP